MKKFIATARVRNLAMSLFFLLGLMFVNVGSASAQATVGGSSTNWYTDGLALNTLTQNVKVLKQPGGALAQNDPSTAVGAQLEAKYHFWVGIMESINGGMSTEAAYFANFGNMVSQPSQQATSSSASNANTPIDTKAIQTETLVLLTY